MEPVEASPDAITRRVTDSHPEIRLRINAALRTPRWVELGHFSYDSSNIFVSYSEREIRFRESLYGGATKLSTFGNRSGRPRGADNILLLNDHRTQDVDSHHCGPGLEAKIGPIGA
jgi:hypothetical protein